ncbi:MAG: amidase [Pseudomonadota bacterium]
MTGPVRARIDGLLALIAAKDHAVRSFIDVGTDRAQADADARDRAPGQGPLHGLVFGVKDNLARAGAAWTAGIAGRRALKAAEDATAVVRLSGAGAVLIGGLNMEEAALGAVTDNPAFGRCNNPLLDGYTPGGSSGGSAAAVAAGFVDAALGTDTMGSVRLPAAYCGVAGLKPTTGLIGRSGLAYLSPSLDTIGPLAPHARDLWPISQALVAPDTGDPLSTAPPPEWYDAAGFEDLAGLRFAIPDQLGEVDIELPVRQGLERAARALHDLGGTTEWADLADWSPGRARRAGLLVVEAEGAEELADLMDQPGALSDHLHRLLVYGRDASPDKILDARAEIARAGSAANTALRDADFLVLPTAPQRAFPHGIPPPANQADLTALANFAGLPAVAIPAPLLDQRLPASIQIIGPAWSEARLLAVAALLQDALAK